MFSLRSIQPIFSGSLKLFRLPENINHAIEPPQLHHPHRPASRPPKTA
ncbi:hypothetical protein EIKCOROL_00059 [Eikenella corrodens ATCC 23834]|uniref:Uncharacterized protein n=1 Tax=Eikenella corrodens ATCC 23834 TaxID=546274 RepID=C0DRU3_EIKCO|nr:hypothetical protein EIKCOROL_00059 [Eikenella corrodens ATCC 23834]